MPAMLGVAATPLCTPASMVATLTLAGVAESVTNMQSGPPRVVARKGPGKLRVRPQQPIAPNLPVVVNRSGFVDHRG